eukprot:CAMPEP_0179873700 /NCGR_PEP_ID=MMETSP0982-20121206/22385_1 /TAXON_ID=483367 /ORGANISM="non described non described, Strain CCMP 2436" /LENGTH=46 /DNA_ID= /DNA_START= /DNA_END= /DNA_ORIENTATION=
MTLDERHPLPLRRVQGGVILKRLVLTRLVLKRLVLKRLLPLPLRRV